MNRKRVSLLYLIALLPTIIGAVVSTYANTLDENIVYYTGVIYYIYITGITTYLMVQATKEYFEVIGARRTFMHVISLILGFIGIFTQLAVTVSHIQEGELFGNVDNPLMTYGLWIILGSPVIYIIFNIINILKNNKYKQSKLAESLMAIIYTVASPLLIFTLATMDPMIIVYLLVVVMTTDTFGYIVGINFGKTKLSSISPKKTVEGAIAGIVASVIMVMPLIAASKAIGSSQLFSYMSEIPLIAKVIITMLVSIISQIGDLYASSVKRNYGVKDFGTSMGEHGGMLDRVDGLLFAILVIVMTAITITFAMEILYSMSF